MPVSLASNSAGSPRGALVPIAQQTINGTVGQVYFNNIPQTYQDLMVVVNARDTITTQLYNAIGWNFNNNNSLVQSARLLLGDGTSPTSTALSNTGYQQFGLIPGTSTQQNTMGSVVAHILNYTNSTTNKTMLSKFACDFNGTGVSGMYINLAQTTLPVTAFSCFVYGANSFFTNNSTFSLYGVRTINQ
jgi:hypothetical protein